jgi:hypothetical protein
MKSWREALRDSLFSGAVATVAVVATAAALGKKYHGSARAPVGAASHVIWGDRAGDIDSQPPEVTIPGLMINGAACVFWAVLYEKLVGENPDATRALMTGGGVAALAYAIDYHVVPRRLTPGFELTLPPRALFGIFAALALGLGLSSRLRRTTTTGEPSQVLRLENGALS